MSRSWSRKLKGDIEESLAIYSLYILVLNALHFELKLSRNWRVECAYYGQRSFIVPIRRLPEYHEPRVTLYLRFHILRLAKVVFVQKLGYH